MIYLGNKGEIRKLLWYHQGKWEVFGWKYTRGHYSGSSDIPDIWEVSSLCCLYEVTVVRKEPRMVKTVGWAVKISCQIGNHQEKYNWIEKKFNFRYAESAVSVGPLGGVAQWAMKVLIWSSGGQSQRYRSWSDGYKDKSLFSDTRSRERIWKEKT